MPHTSLTAYRRLVNVGTYAAAVRHALDNDHRIGKYADPTEPAREDITADEAVDISEVDPSLIYIEMSALDAAATEPAATTRHTPGPWVVDWQGLDHPIYAGETCVATAWAGDADANAARIVACVNALDGVDDPAAALGSIAGFLEDVARGCDPDEARTIAADLLALLGAR